VKPVPVFVAQNLAHAVEKRVADVREDPSAVEKLISIDQPRFDPDGRIWKFVDDNSFVLGII
jgi:hypothetical protein